MKIIILAAGKGRRLENLTKNITKPQVEIQDKPIIEYIIDSFLKTDMIHIDDIIVVGGYKIDKLKEFLSKKYPEINLVFNPDHDNGLGNIYSVDTGLKELKENESFMIVVGDHIIPSSIYKKTFEYLKNKKNYICIPICDNMEVKEKNVKINLDKDGKVTSYGRDIENQGLIPLGINCFDGLGTEKYRKILSDLIRQKKFYETFNIISELVKSEKELILTPLFNPVQWFKINTKNNLENAEKNLNFDLILD